MVLNVEVDVYVKHNSMLKEDIYNAYSLVLVQCIKQLKREIKQSKGWSEASTKFNVLDIFKITKSVNFKVEEQKYLPLSLHKAKKIFHTLNQ